MLWNFFFQNQLLDIIAWRCAMRLPPKNLYFPLPQGSMRTTFHYPESPYGRTNADVITKRMDSLDNGWIVYQIILVMVLRACKELRYYERTTATALRQQIRLFSSALHGFTQPFIAIKGDVKIWQSLPRICCMFFAVHLKGDFTKCFAAPFSPRWFDR